MSHPELKILFGSVGNTVWNIIWRSGVRSPERQNCVCSICPWKLCILLGRMPLSSSFHFNFINMKTPKHHKWKETNVIIMNNDSDWEPNKSLLYSSIPHHMMKRGHHFHSLERSISIYVLTKIVTRTEILLDPHIPFHTPGSCLWSTFSFHPLERNPIW